MKREQFVKVVEDELDSLPEEFRRRIRNVAVLVEDLPPHQPPPQSCQQRRLLLGLFHGVPTTKKSIFDLPTGPDHIVPCASRLSRITLFRRCRIASVRCSVGRRRSRKRYCKRRSSLASSVSANTWPSCGTE